MQLKSKVVLGAGGSSIGVLTDVTYTEAVALQTASTIVPGAKYRMTDFQTLHKIPGTSDRNDTNVTIPVEVLILTGKSTTEFETRVYSETYPDDIIEYTTDNTAWKDLQIAGQKGCITYRVDTLNNIKVGNGDWRNFIVRRWAVDLSAYGRGAIVWKLWATSVNCGVTTAGATQTFTALDTNVYNATTNPDGYRDFRIFGDAITASTVQNVEIGTSVAVTTFPMPNMFLETVAFASSTNSFRNVKINSLNNATFTNEVTRLSLTTLEDTIFTDPIGLLNCLTGNFRIVFFAKRLFNEGNIGNLVTVTLFEDTSDYGGTQGAVFFNIKSSYIRLTGNLADLAAGRNIVVQYVMSAYCIIDKSYANSYVLIDFNFNTYVSTFIANLKDISAYTTNLKFDTISSSNIETSAAAAAAITLSSAIGATILDMFAGIINLTGSGTVNIATLTRFLPNNFPVTLKPAAGLIISINQNNVANGFVNKDLVTANGTNGEVIILTPVGDRWSAQGNKIGEIATNTPADPATTNSLVGVMMGLAVSFTPRKTGNTLVLISGDMDNDTASDGSQVQIRFGIGAAPANGAALTGTQAGGLIKMLNSDATTPGRVPFTCSSLLPLTVDVANWVDVSLASITGGISRIRDISVTLMER